MSKKLIHLLSLALLLSMAGTGWAASNPDPADGAIHESTFLAVLEWTPDSAAVSQDVYFGDNFEQVDSGTGETFRGNQITSLFIVGLVPLPGLPNGLVRGTTYYWRIDDVAADGTKTKGKVWSFLMHPKEAYNPDPADGAESTDPEVTLNWAEGYNALIQTIYFSGDLATVNNATTGGATVVGSPTYDPPGPLEPSKTYYWRVDTLGSYGLIKGDVWRFTTASPAAHAPSLADGNLRSSGRGGDPVNTFTGGLFRRFPADLNLRGPMPLFFSRHYDSFIRSDGDITSRLGDNWLSNFDMTLTQDGPTVKVMTSRGRLIQFEQNGASWNLAGKTDVAYQLVQSGTDFILGDPHTGRMYTFALDWPNTDPDPLIIDDFTNPAARIEARSQTGTFPVTVGTTVEGLMLGGECDALLALDAAGNSGDGASFTIEQGRAVFLQDATSMGRVMLCWDGVDGNAAQIVASTGLGGGVDLTRGGTVDAIEIEVVRNDLPLKATLLVYAGVVNSSELTLDIPATDSPATFRFAFSDLVGQAAPADLTRVTTVIVLIGAMGSASGAVHIEIDSVKMASSANQAIPSDAARRLARIEDGRGNVHTLTYSGETLSSVSDGLGRTLNFTYTGDHLTSVDDGTRTLTFDHTGNDLTSYTDPLGNTTTYAYAAGGLMTAATRPAGNAPHTQTYDDTDRVATQTDALGNTHTFSYNAAETVMTDPLGHTRVHTHNAKGELTDHQGEEGLTVSMGYDGNGRRSAITDRLGDTTTYTYHAESSKLASVTNADGTTISYEYTARIHSSGIVFHDLTGIAHPDGTTDGFGYDASGNMISHTDRAGKVWSFTYNGNSQVLTATNPAGGVTTNTYNPDGTLASRTDPAGNTTTFGYDSLKRLNLVTRADGATVAYTHDDKDNILTITDERGNTTTFTYDENDNLATVTDRLGHTTTFAYDDMDRVISVTDPLGHSATRTYDELQRLQTITGRNGDTTTFDYDARGRLIAITDGEGKIWSRTHDLESVIASATDPLPNTTTFGSDQMGRINRATSPLSHVTRMTYDSMGRMTAVENPLGEITTCTYDARGRVSDVTLADGAVASYARDDLGQITTVTDPAGNDWRRAHDAQGRLTSTTDPLGNVTTYQYDERNRISTVNLPAGTVGLRYDSVGNLTRRLYSDGTDLNYVFDAMNRLTGAEGLTLGYDANGRIIRSNGLTLTRDAGGRPASLTIAADKIITYTYDNRDRLTRVIDWLGGTTTFIYDAAGRLTDLVRPNGVTTSYTYDHDNRLTGITESGISNITLTRDGKGQITAATRDLPASAAQAKTYTYDDAGRLTGDGTRSYTWDPASRLTGSTEGTDTVTFAYDAASQISAYTYDRMGRLTQDRTRTYTWDLTSRMTGYVEGTDTVTFTCDALGQRVSRTEGGVTRRYVWNYALGLPSVSVIREGGNDLRYYVHTPDGNLLYSVEATDSGRRFYHFDEMGNTVFLTDGAGAVVGSYAYSPFGRRLSSADDLDNPFTWQGWLGVMDEGNGLYYIRARYYDSATARFISRDPIKSIGPRSINPYQYAWNNPLRFVDRSGMDPDEVVSIIPELTEYSVAMGRCGGGPLACRGRTDEPSKQCEQAGAPRLRPSLIESYSDTWIESYSSDAGDGFRSSWFDGYGGDRSLGGSMAGHFDSPFIEPVVVYNGTRPLPLFIDNDGGFIDIDGKASSPTFSEVVRELESQDSMLGGIEALTLWFFGTGDNDVPRDTLLSWTPGENAQTHDVYVR